MAITLSPRTVAVLNESFRFISLLAAEPMILHIGEDTPAARKKIEMFINESSFSQQPPPYLIRPGDIITQMLNVAKKTKADLIIAGALIKEGLLTSSMSKVARQLAMKAPCSVLLLVDPSLTPHPLKKVLCLVEYSRSAKLAVMMTDEISRTAGSHEVLFAHVFRFPKGLNGNENIAARAAKIRRLYYQQDVKLHRYLARVLGEESRYRVQCIHEQSRTAMLDFIKEFCADLLGLPTPRQIENFWSHLITPTDFTYLLKNLPCSLLLTRKASHR